jgi:RNA recognition motif-containing protein
MMNIFVARLDFGVSQEELRRVFEQYGKVNKVTIATDKETGKPKGFAFVEMFNDEEAQSAIKSLDGYNCC